MGNNLTNHSHTHPADLLVPNWVLGKPAAFGLSVTSPLNPTTLLEVSVTTGVAALTTELRKHSSNCTKCKELDWVCVPLVVESYGAWENKNGTKNMMMKVTKNMRMMNAMKKKVTMNMRVTHTGQVAKSSAVGLVRT